MALNTSVSRMTHETPELMMFGHEAEKNCYNLVSLTWVNSPMSHGTPRHSAAERSRYIWEAILPESSHKLEMRNKNKKSNTLEEGDLVWRQIMQPLVAGTRHALDS